MFGELQLRIEPDQVELGQVCSDARFLKAEAREMATDRTVFTECNLVHPSKVGELLLLPNEHRESWVLVAATTRQ